MKTKALSDALIGLLVATAPSALLAQPEAGTGWSIEVKALDAESEGTVAGFRLDDERTGTSVGGAYAFNQYFSVHAAYADHGKHYATDCIGPVVCAIQNVDQIDLKTLSVGVTGTWPVTDVIELFGKVGIAGWDADFTAFALDDSDRDVVVGAGIGARITPDWRISLQYERVDGIELESVGIALAYQF